MTRTSLIVSGKIKRRRRRRWNRRRELCVRGSEASAELAHPWRSEQHSQSGQHHGEVFRHSNQAGPRRVSLMLLVWSRSRRPSPSKSPMTEIVL